MSGSISGARRPGIGRFLAAFWLCVISGAALAVPGPELLPAPASFADPLGVGPSEIVAGQAADGRAVIAYLRNDRLLVQRLAADGSADGDVTQLLSGNGTALRGLALSVGSNGHYAVAAQVGLAQDARIVLRRYAPDGTEIPFSYGPDDAPLNRLGVPSCVVDPNFVAFSSPALSIDSSGNLAYAFTRSAFCPTGPGNPGAEQPNQTELYYRYAPVAGQSSMPILVFEQSPLDAGNARVIDTVHSAVALQDNGALMLSWNGHETANQPPRSFVRTANQDTFTSSSTAIDAANSFDRSAPLLAAKSGGYVLSWRGDYNDPQSGAPQTRCYAQAFNNGGTPQFAVLTLNACSDQRALIVQDSGVFDLIKIPQLGQNPSWTGRRYDASGIETAVYSNGVPPNRFLDEAVRAWAPTLAGGNYLAVYTVEQADGSRSLLEPVRYAGPDGTPALTMELSPASTLTIDDGRTVTLSWRSNAAPGNCFGYGNLGGRFDSSGQRVLGSFSTAGERIYGLACGPDALTQDVRLNIIDNTQPTVSASWSPATITIGQSSTVSYSSENAVACTASLTGEHADSAGADASGSATLTFTQPGDVVFTYTCANPGGTATTSATLQVIAPATKVSASWLPAAITIGQSSTVSFSSENAQACEASLTGEHADTAGAETSGSVTLRFTQPGNVVFTYTCTGPGGTATARATLRVMAPPTTVTASWSPATITIGQSSTVSYSSENAVACTASLTGEHADSAGADASGSATLTFTQPGDVVFTYTCANPGGTATTSATLHVIAPATKVSASWLPAAITIGQSSTVSFSSENAQACEASLTGEHADTAGAETSGSVTLRFTQPGNVVFTYTCTGPGGTATARATLRVMAPPTTVTASWSPATITIGQSSTVSYSSENAVACTASLTGEHADSAGADASGSATLTFTQPGDVTFTYSCAGVGGTTSTSAVLHVTASPTTVTASWSPAEIVVGQASTVSYSSENALACEASLTGEHADSAGANASGSLTATFSQPGDVVFTYTCVGPNGSASTTATLSVSAAPPSDRIDLQLNDGRVVQLATSAGSVVNARTVARPATLPAGFMPITDFIGFDITGIANGATVDVVLTLPSGLRPTTYLKCTPDCSVFTGASFSDNRVRLTLTDGGAGDADGIANGVINDPGAPAIAFIVNPEPPTTDASKSGGGATDPRLILGFAGALLCRWRRQRVMSRH